MSLKELEKFYEKTDPWGYRTNPDDQHRRLMIFLATQMGKEQYDRLLDIGCGEGFITEAMPAKEKHGIELSDEASARLPEDIKRVEGPEGKYDLVLATGVMYEHYDYNQIVNWIWEAAGDIVVTCNIKEWEKDVLPKDKQIFEGGFPYREYEQKLRVFKW